MGNSESKKTVVAIEIGNVNSGYAYGIGNYKDCHIYTATHGYGLPKDRVPTALLLKNNAFDAFGYCAQDKFMSLTLQGDNLEYKYFNNLNIIERNGEYYICDIQGTEMLADDIYAIIIKYLYDSCMEQVANNRHNNTTTILILCVSNESETIRDIIQSALEKIETKDNKRIKDNTRIVLDTDAAAAYCRYQALLMKRPTFILVNLGGYTSKFCCQKVLSKGRYKELKDASALPHGGETVTDAFLHELGKQISNLDWNEFKNTNYYDYMYTRQSFDENKHKFSDHTESMIIDLPLSVVKLFETSKMASSSDGLAFTKDSKMIITQEKMASLFSESLKEIVCKIETYEDVNEQNDVLVFLAGGYSESSYVRDFIKKAVEPKRALLVPDPSLAVMKGAVRMGFEPTMKSVFTYGFIRPDNPDDSPNFTLITRKGKSVFFQKIISRRQILVNDTPFLTDLHIQDDERHCSIILYKTRKDGSEHKDSDFIQVEEISPPENGWNEIETVEVKVTQIIIHVSL
ncbi:uncharacterized protein LOC123556035 [Mercenaria mercenaria]|uniref:uncharacterized protein LOC123556035 n=1 Tax=Mercenaria mercenaria TaxID=6596 RepID=UPI00234E8012|nr:uncharacterized protein LOC123556035 [Mercenaria mercenaria]